MRDLANRVVPVSSIAPVVQAADVNGTGVDLIGFNSATVVVASGVEGVTLSASVYFEIILEDSDDDSTYTAVTASTSVTNGSVSATGVFLTLNANGETPQVSEIGYIGGKRYIRAVIDQTGTMGTGTPFSITVIKGDAIDAEDADLIA
tara:strand:+ start:1846 stop:2289 length:444 start_codon:yes stop_codon:yes gene_type:complete